jgi:hypothetical protein
MADPAWRSGIEAKMGQPRSELTLEQNSIIVSALRHVTERPTGGIVLPQSAFGPSHSHRVWRMMNALIDAMPEWADAHVFEEARVKMLQFGLAKGMSLEELHALSDPDVILDLWTAAEAQDVEV